MSSAGVLANKKTLSQLGEGMGEGQSGRPDSNASLDGAGEY